MARTKEYVINISPISWQRAKLSNKRFYDGQTSEKLACGLHLDQQHAGEPPFEKAVHVDATFYMPIPKSICKRKNTPWVTTFPDLDNLQKFIFDTLTQTGIWKDDRLMCSLTTKKIYDKQPRTHLVITELE